jgi:hypothetical protein
LVSADSLRKVPLYSLRHSVREHVIHRLVRMNWRFVVIISCVLLGLILYQFSFPTPSSLQMRLHPSWGTWRTQGHHGCRRWGPLLLGASFCGRSVDLARRVRRLQSYPPSILSILQRQAISFAKLAVSMTAPKSLSLRQKEQRE